MSVSFCLGLDMFFNSSQARCVEHLHELLRQKCGERLVSRAATSPTRWKLLQYSALNSLLVLPPLMEHKANLVIRIPLAGGPFNWVSILAPPWCKNFLSYLAGWLTVLTWQATVAASAYVAGTMIQGLLVPELSIVRLSAVAWHSAVLCSPWLCFASQHLFRMVTASDRDSDAAFPCSRLPCYPNSSCLSCTSPVSFRSIHQIPKSRGLEH